MEPGRPSPHPASARPRRTTVAAVVAVTVGVAVSLGAFQAARRYELREARMELERDVSDRLASIQHELDQHLWMLAAVRAIWDGTGGVDRAQFGQMVRPLLEQYSALRALEWVPLVPGDERERFEAAVRAEGLTDFEITERGPSGELVAAGRRSTHYPVLFAEPLDRNRRVLGYDLGSNAERLETLMLACKRGEQQTTGPVRLVQDPEEAAAFLTVQPIYRRGAPVATERERQLYLEGFAVAAFRADEIIDSALEGLSPLPVAWSIVDETGPRSAPVWSDPPLAGAASRTSDWRHDVLDAGGREWTVRYRPLGAGAPAGPLSWILLGTGLLLTALLALHLRSLDVRARDLSAANVELSALIREREAAEERRREAQRTLATLMSNLPGLAYRCRDDRARTMEFMSDGCLELTGHHPREFLAGEVAYGAHLVHPGDRERVWELVQLALGDRRPFQMVYRIVRRDGAERWVWEQGRGVYSEAGELDAVEGLVTDITVQKRVEESLTKEKRFSDSVIDSLPGVFYLFTEDGEYLRWNKDLEEVTGYTSAEIAHMSPLDFLPEDEHARVRAAIEETFREGASSIESALLSKDGVRTPYFLTGRRVTLDGRACLVGMGVDVAERKRAVAELERERRMFTGGPAVVVSWAAAEGWPVEYVSPNAPALFGYSAEDLTSGRVAYLDLVHPDDRERVAAAIEGHLARGDGSSEQDYRIVRADGEVRWLYDFAVLARDETGTVTHRDGYVLDVTERRRAEQEREQILKKVLEAQKLESVGLLAGGIAHDFNNLLTSLVGHVDFALERLPAASPARADLEQARVAANRAGDLTQQLLAYAGRGTFEREPIDVSGHIREIGDLLHTSLSKKVSLELDLEADLPAVEADAAQIQQLVMNLVINGAEACGHEPGTVRVRTRLLAIAERRAVLTALGGPLEPGTYVSIEVRDTGCGMDAATVRRIFDPFFTTKFTGRGLGLAAALGIVRAHGGALDVESEPGVGSTFEVLLPASDRPAVALPGSEQQDLSGAGTILVADDEPAVLRVAGRALEQRGYRVLLCENGREAVELFRRHADEVALVLLDMTMPEMNGAEVFQALCQIRASVRVLLSSGWNEEEAVSQFEGAALAGFLQKPYTPDQLAAKVKEVLTAAERHPRSA